MEIVKQSKEHLQDVDMNYFEHCLFSMCLCMQFLLASIFDLRFDHNLHLFIAKK